MKRLPEGLPNLLCCVTAWNGWKEPHITPPPDPDRTDIVVTMSNGIVIVFQPEDDLFLVQAITLKGQKTRIMHVEKDDYAKMELLLKACHSA